jgi:hypothetical protein
VRRALVTFAASDSARSAGLISSGNLRSVAGIENARCVTRAVGDASGLNFSR